MSGIEELAAQTKVFQDGPSTGRQNIWSLQASATMERQQLYWSVIGPNMIFWEFFVYRPLTYSLNIGKQTNHTTHQLLDSSEIIRGIMRDQEKDDTIVFIYDSKLVVAKRGQVLQIGSTNWQPCGTKRNFNDPWEIGKEDKNHSSLLVHDRYSLSWTPVPANFDTFSSAEFFRNSFYGGWLWTGQIVLTRSEHVIGMNVKQTVLEPNAFKSAKPLETRRR